MKRKAAEEVGEGPATKKQATSSQAQRDFEGCFREGLFELEDQREQYAQSQP